MKKFMATLVWCLSFSWKASRFYTFIRITIQMIPPLLGTASSFVGKYIIDLLSGAWRVSDAERMLLYLFGGLLTAALLRMACNKATLYFQALHDDIINGEMSLMMMDRSLSSDLEYFDNPEYYDQLQAASQGSMAISYILWNVFSCVSSFVSFIMVFTIFTRFNILYSGLMILAAVPSSVGGAKFTKLLYVLNMEQLNEHRRMYYCQSIATDKGFAQEMRLYNIGDRLKDRYKTIWKNLFTQKKNMARKRTWLTGLLECLPEIMVGYIGVNIALRVLAGQSTVGDYSLYMGLAGQLWMAINMFSASSLNIYDNKLKIDNIKGMDKFKNHVLDNGQSALKQIDTITFEDVSFSYPGTARPVLNNISFHLRKEEKLVLVGLNGSGKSTLIKLLLRMYDPDSGVIRVNGLDIKEYKLAVLRAHFSVYFQETRNFCFTLKENVTIADDGRADGEESIKHAIMNANGGDIMEMSPKGLDTGITRIYDTQGLELSGGQHQKLALARAFYRRHTALILDEPSSNLDPQAEDEIFKSLKHLTDGKMTLFTSHRLSNVLLADRIIVLEKGRIIEDGTQAELMANKHRFAELYKAQQEKYVS